MTKVSTKRENRISSEVESSSLQNPHFDDFRWNILHDFEVLFCLCKVDNDCILTNYAN